MPTVPPVNPKPDLAGLTPDEVWARKRHAANQPVPRETCPGCLRPLAGFPRQVARGWCRLCWPTRDAMLAELLRVPDPAWTKPDALARRERDLGEVERTAERLAEGAEVAKRRAAELRAELTYARASAHVCVQCGDAPAARPSTLCQLCSDIASAPPPMRQPHACGPACPHHGRPDHVCGAQGFGLEPDDRCPACEASRDDYA